MRGPVPLPHTLSRCPCAFARTRSASESSGPTVGELAADSVVFFALVELADSVGFFVLVLFGELVAVLLTSDIDTPYRLSFLSLFIARAAMMTRAHSLRAFALPSSARPQS
mgnify:CR=1 FL=1